MEELKKENFGNDFAWGLSKAAYQVEGAYNTDGKGLNIWDTFSNKKGKIASGHTGNVACDFYNRYEDDIDLLSSLNIPNLRFSISWSRIIPEGTGMINQKVIDYYNKVIDQLLEKNITPWITLYHWDLPQKLEDKGGWTNRDIINWFSEYVNLCAQHFGDRVKNWMTLNEPMVSTGAGHFLGIHAPGRRGPKNFLSAVHHTALCQAEGSRILRANLKQANIGTTFSCSPVEAFSQSKRDIHATKRMDALLNRLFIEPSLGMGYPVSDLPFLERIEKYFQPGDVEKLKFDFDFIGLQNYTREIIRYDFLAPFIHAKIVSATKRKVPVTAMGWEIYPESIYTILKKFNSYSGIKKIIITESGIGLFDKPDGKIVPDTLRIRYLQEHLKQILKAKQEGVRVDGFFVWTFMDNFEWAEGYHPRFGLVYVNFETQERIIKNSGYWYRDFNSR